MHSLITKTTASVSPFFLLVGILSGCAEGFTPVDEWLADTGEPETATTTETIEEPCDPTIPESTGYMQYEWLQAQGQYDECMIKAEIDYDYCLLTSDGDYDECHDWYDATEANCRYWYMVHVNKIPLRYCGVQVYMIENEDDYTWDVNDNDEDGDGISTWMEYLMGSNVCEYYTWGECSTSDYAADYDADGVPNGEDDNPICNEQDPGNAQIDCV